MRKQITVAMAIGVLALAGCGGDDESSSSGSGSSGSSDSSSSGGGEQLALAADPDGALAFDKKTLNAKAGEVTINFENPATVPHAVEVEGNGVEEKTDVVTEGKASLTADLEPGTYEFYCPVGDHREEGMEGTLTVK